MCSLGTVHGFLSGIWGPEGRTHTLALPRSCAPSGLAHCCGECPSHPPGTPSSKASYHLLTKGPLLPGMAVRFQSPQLLLGGQLSLKSPTAAKTPEGGIPAQPCAEDLGHDWPLSDSVVGEPKVGGPVGQHNSCLPGTSH